MPQISAAQAVEDSLNSARIPFCIIGGMALFRWGEPRVTQDVDLTVLCRLGDEDSVVDSLLKKLPARIADAKQFALKHRVLLLKVGTINIDISLGALFFEENAIARSSRFEYASGVHLTTCSAEDLIVFKAFAARPRDWLDIESILIRQGNALDWKQILFELGPLVELKEQPEILDRLAKLRTDLVS